MKLIYFSSLLSFSYSLALPSQAGAVNKRSDTLPGAIIPLTRKSAIPSRRKLKKRVGRNVGLSVADGNQEFVAQVSFGTPWTSIQTFNLPVDTASSDTWLAASNFTCEDYINDCDAGPLYNASPSFIPNNASLIDQYGIGNVMGNFGTDTVTIGGFVVPSATVAIATSGQWAFEGTSGLLGLGGSLLANLWYPPYETPTPYTPLIPQMINEGIINANFTLALSQTGGYLSLGTVDLPSDVKHADEWVATSMPPYSSDPVNGTRYSYYGIEVQALVFPNHAGKNLSYAFNNWMIVDSGTSALIFPDAVANALNDLWDPQPDPYDGTIPCSVSDFSRVPTLDVVVESYIFQIDPQTLIAQYPTGACASAILPDGDEEGEESPVILGTPFLMNVVAVFDLGDGLMRLSSASPA